MIFQRQLPKDDKYHHFKRGFVHHKRARHRHVRVCPIKPVCHQLNGLPENKLIKQVSPAGLHDNIAYNKQNVLVYFLTY